MGAGDDAVRALRDARAAASKLADAPVRAGAMADIIAAEAMIAPSPREAIPLLTNAIDYHRSHGRLLRLPELFLSRGRAYRKLGDTAQAAADFEGGIAEMER